MAAHILIIGTDRNTLAALEFILESEGYGVSAVQGNGDAIDAPEGHIPADLLILDEGRPGDRDSEALRRFAERGFRPPMIVLASRRRNTHFGDAVIEKPVRRNTLLRTVEEVLRRAEERPSPGAPEANPSSQGETS